MRKLRPRTLKIAMTALVLFVLFQIWAYVTDIHRRFPNLDLKQARVGIASWYSKTDKHINKHTANHEVFNDQDDTCATWNYDFGDELLVINAFTGAWVVCRVNDRG